MLDVASHPIRPRIPGDGQTVCSRIEELYYTSTLGAGCCQILFPVRTAVCHYLCTQPAKPYTSRTREYEMEVPTLAGDSALSEETGIEGGIDHKMPLQHY